MLIRLLCLAFLVLSFPAAAQQVGLAKTGYGDALTPAQITASQNDYAPSGCSRYIPWRLDASAAWDITGISAALCAPAPGTNRMRVLINVGSFTITLKDESASSTAANRFALAADFSLTAGASVQLLYDSTSSRWRIVGLEAAAGGSGETNTASNLGGGLANFDSKLGVDLRFNTFAAADFDLASNLITIDTTKWATDAEVAAGYQPLDSDLTSIAALSTTSHGRGLLDDADATASRTSIGAAASGAVGSTGITMNTARLLGRTAASAGVIEEITVGSPLTFSGGALDIAGIADADLASNYSGVGACGANTWASTLNDNTAPTCTQPTFSNLSGSAAIAQGGTTETASTEDAVLVGAGTTDWQPKVLPSCSNGTTDKLLYNSSTNAFSCGTDQTGGGGGWTTVNFGTTTSNSTTTPTTITGFTIPVTSGQNVRVRCRVVTDAAATTTGVQITFAGPTASQISVERRSCSSVTAIVSASMNSFTADNRTASGGTTRCTEGWHITAFGTSSSTSITGSLDSEVGSSQVRVFEESYCEYTTF